MNEIDDAGRTRRETPATVLTGRAARELVSPIQERLGLWQAECIKLEAMAQRMKAAGRRDAGLAETVRTLHGMIEMQTRTFDLAMGDAPSAVRQHNRVTDTRKVLGMLAERLAALLAELGEPRDKPR